MSIAGVKASLARHWAMAIEPAALVALILVASVTSALWPTTQARSFWAEMGCAGYLLPKKSLAPSVSGFRELKTAEQRSAAFRRGAREAGFDGRASHAVGESAALLCNSPAREPRLERSVG